MHDGTAETDADRNTGTGIVQEIFEEESRLVSVPLQDYHDTSGFRCWRSSRVEGFFGREWPELSGKNYCKVFVIEDSTDKKKISGYYTLSSAVLEKDKLSGSDERRSPFGFHAPMARIGFMGRSNDSDKGLGQVLLVDAALRVLKISDLGIWGLVLEPEGGNGNTNSLAGYYRSMGFKTCRSCQSMYVAAKDIAKR
jgi:hypothetical protein